MNVRKETITPPPPPPGKIVIELDMTEAKNLRRIVGYIGGNPKGPVALFNKALFDALVSNGVAAGSSSPFASPVMFREGI